VDWAAVDFYGRLQVCVQPFTAAVHATAVLRAAAAPLLLGAVQQSVDIAYPPDLVWGGQMRTGPSKEPWIKLGGGATSRI